ncbi:hypothetical protein [Neobacillus drentensis]
MTKKVICSKTYSSVYGSNESKNVKIKTNELGETEKVIEKSNI